MTARHSPLTAAEVIAKNGWHPRYARVIALASDDGYSFALADGNGDGSELGAEAWTWRDGTWQGAANGSAPSWDTVTIAFDGKADRAPSATSYCHAARLVLQA